MGNDPVMVKEAADEVMRILGKIEQMDFPIDWVRIPETIINQQHRDEFKRQLVYEIRSGETFDMICA